MNYSEALSDIKSFLHEAGALATEAQPSITMMLKDGDQALTETDLAISRLAHQRLAHWLSQSGHVLIDEESIDQVGSPQEIFRNSEFQWVLDPIDGTAGYAAGRQQYGISLGLLHKGKPILGGIYLPSRHELIFADGSQAWRTINAFTPMETTSCLKFSEKLVNSQTFVESYFGKIWSWDSSFSPRTFWLNTPESAVQGFFSLFSGQAVGATWVPLYSIWDVAAAAAIGQQAGFITKTMRNKNSFELFDSTNVKPNWKITESWLCCAPSNFDTIRNGLME